jgi:hypothetical protein
MGGSPFLGVSVLAASPTLILYNNPPSSITLGSTFGAAETASTASQPLNRAVYFTANNINNPSGSAGAIYTSTGTGIYRSLDGGNSWTLALTPTSLGGGGYPTSAKTGLNIVTGTDGLQYLCFLYQGFSGGDFCAGYRTTDGYTWTRDVTTAFTIDAVGLRQDTVLGSVLYCLQNSSVLFYDVTAGVIGSVSIGSAILDRAAMCVWDNAIYVAGYLTATGGRPLYRIDGGKVSQVVNLATSGTTATTTNKLGMFVDSSNLYVFSLRVASSTGWACYQVDTPGTYNVTDITSTVITGNMAGAGPGTNSRVLTYVDGNNTPGVNPAKYVLYSADGNDGTGFQMFQWNGSSTAMTAIATGGNVAHGITVSKAMTNNGTYDPFAVYPYIISSNPTTSGTVGWRINFTLWGPSGTTTSIRLWYGVPDDEYLTFVGTLAAPSSGSLGANNTSITGLAVDSGVTLYSVTWLPPTNITTAANSRFSFTLQPF